MRQIVLASLLGLALTAGAAKADVISTFDISGTTADPSGSLSGTMTVDVTSGTIESVTAMVPAARDIFDMLSGSQPYESGWTIDVGNATGRNDILTLDFTTTPPDSLVGFDGGNIFLGSDLNGLEIFSGSITLLRTSSPTVPEPSSLALLIGGVGLLGLGTTLTTRRRVRSTTL